jgi:DNA-binding NarL/FixJ family response regulator
MPRRRTPPAPARPLRVLLADDDGDYMHALAALLGSLDWIEVVDTASDGAGAVRLFSETTPDVVVMDLLMPGMDGVEATKRIVEADPLARVLILTATEDARALALCISAGARACLWKEPATPRMLPLMLMLMSTRVLGAAATPSQQAQKGN